MNGLELSRAFYETHGRQMLESEFSHLLPLLAVGVFGSGSECFGYDDAVSRDHDYEPGFCVFLPEEELVSRRDAFLLERAYSRLPRSFQGVERPVLQPVGGPRRGVFRTEDFFRKLIGSPNGALTISQWMTLPEQALLECTNGAVFLDEPGEVTAIREKLSYFPEDVRRKKLAGQLLLMAQSGQYNYLRCLKHAEEGGAQLAVSEFVKAGMSAIFLLNRRYQPYYKWSFRALRDLPLLSIEAELFEYLLTTGNDEETAKEKYDVIEGIAADIIDVLMDQHLTKAICGDLEKHAYSVNDQIGDGTLRNLHILAGV